MTEQGHPLTTEEKFECIKNQPIVATLSDNEIKTIAELLVEAKYLPSDEIVKEKDVVDNVYFIVSGKAEVRKEVLIEGRSEQSTIATLKENETIGLTHMGFFSTSGLRSASVVAITPVVTLKLHIAALMHFLETHPHVSEILRAHAEIILRMHLIKRSVPFYSLSLEKLPKVAEQVTKRYFKSGDIIFNQGEDGNECYLVKSGRVEIFITENNDKTTIAKIKPPMVFGEGALISSFPRNASAQATQPTEVLCFSKELLHEIMGVETPVAEAMLKLSQSRVRPLKLPGVEKHIQITDDQTKIIILSDTKKNNYYRTTEKGCFVWEQLNGQRTIREVTLEVYKEYGIFAPEKIAALIKDFEQSGLLVTMGDVTQEEVTFPWPIRFVFAIRKLMQISVSFNDVDNWVTKVYNRFGFIFYTTGFQIVMAILTLLGLFYFSYSFKNNIELLRATPEANWLFWLAIIAQFFSIPLHELAHAFTTKYFGRRVSNFGIGWFWLGPIAFCDTSDMWLSPRRQRIIVDLSGVYYDFFMGSVAILLTLLFKNPYIVIFLWMFTLLRYLNVIFNLSPIIEYDGYYALMDFLGKENLRTKAVIWLIYDAKKTWNKPREWSQYRAEMIYWGACIVFLAIEILIPFLVMNYLLYGLLGVRNPFFSLLLCVFAVITSGLGLWGQMQEQLRKKVNFSR